MIEKRKIPTGIWVVAITLILYSIQAILMAFSQKYMWNFAWAGLAMFGALGLLRLKAWSQYLVYFLAAKIVFQWIFMVWKVYRNGWPYKDLTSSLISLLPGFLLLVVCFSICIVVFKHMNKRD